MGSEPASFPHLLYDPTYNITRTAQTRYLFSDRESVLGGGAMGSGTA